MKRHYSSSFVSMLSSLLIFAMIVVSSSSAANARFISPDNMDPTRSGVGTNRYAYAGNDPVNQMDPNGHFFGIAAGIGVVIGAAISFFSGTKEANAPGLTDKSSNTSDGQQLANMAVGAAGSSIAGKVAGDVANSIFAKKGPQGQTAKEFSNTEQRAEKSTISLYRAVSRAELDEIKATGKFSAGKNTMEGKWFAESAEDATKWGNQMNGPGQSTVVRAEVPTEKANQFFRSDRLDGIGPARYAEIPELEGVEIHW